MLIKCITQDLGFTQGKPVAACLIYKCLLHWRSFEVERTTVFDHIIQTIASAIEVGILIYLIYFLVQTSSLFASSYAIPFPTKLAFDGALSSMMRFQSPLDANIKNL